MKKSFNKHPIDILICLVFSFILIPIVLLDLNSIIRIILGLPFILFIPGYLLIFALFPGKKEIDTIERIALAFGLSIAVVPLIGLILNYTPAGIRLESILLSIFLFNIITGTIAYLRWKKTKSKLRFIVKVNLSFLKTKGKFDQALTIILVALIISSIILLAYLIVYPKTGERFTELYILGETGKASDYPTVLGKGEIANITIGVANHEYKNINYTIEAWLINQTSEINEQGDFITTINHMWFYNKSEVTLNHKNVDIESSWQAQHEEKLTFSIDRYGIHKLVILLFKEKTEDYEVGIDYKPHAQEKLENAYRSVHLWIDIPRSFYTDFFIKGPMGKTTSFSEYLQPKDIKELTIGIHNHEYQTINYTVETWLVNKSVLFNNPINKAETIIHNMWFLNKSKVRLDHKENASKLAWNIQYEQNFSFNFNKSLENKYEVVFLLFKENTSEYDFYEDIAHNYIQKINSAYKKCSYVIAENIGEARIIKNVTNSWTFVSFWKNYVSPVIVSTYNLNNKNDTETVVRIRNVTDTSCQIKLQGLSNISNSSDVHLIILEEGAHTLYDGRKLEARKYTEYNTTNKFDFKNTTKQSYLQDYIKPVIFGQVMSYNDENYSVFWCNNGSKENTPDGNNLYTSKHTGEDKNTRKEEQIGYVVIDQRAGVCTGTVGPLDYVLGSNSNILGVSNGSEQPPYKYELNDNYEIAVASLAGQNSTDGGWPVLYEKNPVSDTINLAIDEDTIKDKERYHETEAVSYIAFSKQGVLKDANKNIGEVRKIENVDSKFTKVQFLNEYFDPVIVTTQNLMQNQNETIVRIRNVKSASCEIKLQKISGKVQSADVHMIILEKGAYELSDGVKLEANKYLENKTSYKYNWTETTQQNYSNDYERPVVLGQVMSYKDKGYSVFWCCNKTRDVAPNKNELFTGKNCGEAKDYERKEEIIGYVVIEQGSGEIGDIKYKAAIGEKIVQGVNSSIPDRSYEIYLPDNYGIEEEFYGSSEPGEYKVGIATINAMKQHDFGWAVLIGENPVNSTLSLAIDEDTYLDEERGHYIENVAFWVFSDEGFIAKN